MNSSSHQVVQQMLPEEQYGFGTNSLAHLPTPQEKTADDRENGSSESIASPEQGNRKGVSHAPLPSHKTRWSAEEDVLLLEGLNAFGFGSWKAIAGHIGTRTPLQCKNHARHWKTCSKSPADSQPVIYPAPEHFQNMIKMPIVRDAEPRADASSPLEPTPVSTPLSNELMTMNNCTSDSGLLEHEDINGQAHTDLMGDSGPTITEKVFDRELASEEEQKRNPEWFCGKPSRTPERYLKIRNGILAGWQACRPQYLTKTNARKRLLDCGDVNAIGRVHGYLEDVGAINVGCVEKSKASRPVRRAPRRMYEYEEMEEDEDFEKALAASLLPPRKRKTRSELTTWDDPDLTMRRGTGPRPKRVIKRPQSLYDGDDFGLDYDPFRLVPLEYYSETDPSPFSLVVSSDALLVMDFHSHLAYTEIIGLLGGTFVTTDEGKQLHVQSVFPCQSISTGIQCEMDPASEMRAREVFEEKGLQVVGWYHSHPKFEPNPSIRDIENQTSYQTLFRDEATGDEPFVGIIVTPFDPEMATDLSRIQYLHISQRWNTSHAYRIPYACKKRIAAKSHVAPDVMVAYQELADEYKDYEHKIDMTLMYGTQKTRLNKLLDALRVHVHTNEQETEWFLENVSQIVTKTLMSGPQVEVNAAVDSCVAAAAVAKTGPVQDAVRSLTI